VNKLYFGDNLEVLKGIPSNSVDLVYLDPPFNSKETYNVLYKSPVGGDAQVRAFDDTWSWEDGASSALASLSVSDHDIFNVLHSMQRFLGTSDMMAYLAMMSVRLVELRRVLKDGGTLYLHCDPTASHYLKIVLDAVFGSGSYINEINWRRTTAKADYKQGATHFPRVRDIILRYGKGRTVYFDQPFRPYDEAYLTSKYNKVDDTGRRYRLDNLTGPGGAAKGNAHFELMGVVRHWRYSRENMDRLVTEGRIIQTRPGGVPQYKRYLDEMPGVPVSEDWDDIRPINSQARERLGYPTQKPVELLKRIIEASSRPKEVVLDPFCGCGTTIHAAEVTGRTWIGIDIAYQAIQVIEDRLSAWLPNATYELTGIPFDEQSARALAKQDPHTFQQWAVARCGGRPGGKGADRGIDGEIVFQRGRNEYGRAIVSVKGGKHISPAMVRELIAVVQREQADLGVFVCLDEPTRDMKSDAYSSGRIDLPGGSRSKIQIVTVADLIRGPDLGILTVLSTVGATVAAKAQARKKPERRPTPEQLRREPPLPPMPIRGGKKAADQVPLNLAEPLLSEPQPKRRRKN